MPKILRVEMSNINQVLWFTWLWTKTSKGKHMIYTLKDIENNLHF